MSTEQDKLLQIGGVAERVDLSLRTLRYWDEVGIARPSTRTEGGFRLYSADDVQRILIAKKMRPLGLTLEEMVALLDALEHTKTVEGASPEDVQRLLDTLSDYESRTHESIATLELELAAARELHALIVERFTHCDAASALLEGTKPGESTT